VESPQFICPGLVDTHTHAPQHLFAGTGMDLQLLEWLNTYTFPTEAKFKDPEFAAKNYKRVVQQNINAGTTSAVYFGTLHLDATKVLADLLKQSGQRAYVGKVNMDRNCPDFYIEETHDSIRDTKVFVDYVQSFQSDLITPCLTPRFVPTCTPELMDFLGKMSRDHKLPLQSHVSENPGEVEWVKSLHPECKGYADTYDRYGCYNSQTIQAHAIYLTDDERKLTKDRGVGIAHCPNSNFSLDSGVLNARRMLKEGIKLGLGTDVAGGFAPNMLECIREAKQASHVVSVYLGKDGEKPMNPAELFYLATMGGADVMGIQDKIGNFQVGKDFDALIVDPTQHGALELYDHDTASSTFEKFLFLADDRHIKNVFVQGNKIKG
jgi:guanine deaminase